MARLPEFPSSLSVAPMSDRLSQLLRQRALLQEHLTWLDREIAAETEKSAPTLAPAHSEGNRAAAPAPPAPATPPLPPAPPSPYAASALPVVSPVVATTVTELAGTPEDSGGAEVILDKERRGLDTLEAINAGNQPLDSQH